MVRVPEFQIGASAMLVTVTFCSVRVPRLRIPELQQSYGFASQQRAFVTTRFLRTTTPAVTVSVAPGRAKVDSAADVPGELLKVRFLAITKLPTHVPIRASWLPLRAASIAGWRAPGSLEQSTAVEDADAGTAASPIMVTVRMIAARALRMVLSSLRGMEEPSDDMARGEAGR